MPKDKMHVHIVFEEQWIRGYLEGCDGGTWSRFKTVVLRKVKEETKQVGSSCSLHFVMSTSRLTGYMDRTTAFRVYQSGGDYGAALPAGAKDREVISRTKAVVKLELKKLKERS